MAFAPTGADRSRTAAALQQRLIGEAGSARSRRHGLLTHSTRTSDISIMRDEADRTKLERLMAEIGERVTGPGVIYLTGGATALLFGWRAATIDVDIKPDPELPGLFEALAALKEALELNIELASPDRFIPAAAGLARPQHLHRTTRRGRIQPL